MLEKVLFTVDFSPFTEHLLGCAEELASVGMKEMVLINVIDAKSDADYGDHANPAFEETRKKTEEALDDLAEKLGKTSYTVKKVVKAGNPALTIVDTAKEENVSFIFMGAHGKGFLNRLILGSVSEKVLKLADRPVMIQQCRIRDDKEGFTCENACKLLLEHVLIANDFSEYADRVRPVLLDFAGAFCAPVTLLHVQEGRSSWGWDAQYREEKRQAKDKMLKMQELAASLKPYCHDVRTAVVKGTPGVLIPKVAEDINASLIIVGAFGHRTVGTLLGGVAEKVVRESERPVLVLKV
jgi:nucleotide-binding universal stress UspA family protein